MLARCSAHLAPPSGPPGPPPAAAQGTAAGRGEWRLCSSPGLVALAAGGPRELCEAVAEPSHFPHVHTQYSMGNVFGV